MTEVRQLLYGVVFGGDPEIGPATLLPAGVGGAPVRVVEACELGATLSAIDPRDAEPSVARALAYAGVVDALHATRTVVPLRFGCVLRTESDVRDLLYARRVELAAMLRELDGCTEMAVRIEEAHAADPPAARNGAGNGCGTPFAPGNTGGDGRARCPPGLATDATPGAAYLARRDAIYCAADRRRAEAARAASRLRHALDGRFVRCQVEAPAHSSPGGPGASPGSVYFLVRREAVESFREVFRAFSRPQQDRLVLSGPWPPYNFVVGGRLATRVA